ncbi:MAG TPA: hypothetical protein DCR40_18165 [Prolixibacteraceae bacterium]|nr:hypothetical protein [Prolixibacteraceae bacterium]
MEAITDFTAKVREMRRLQKEYFRSRDKYILMECKKAESEIDDILSNNQQPVKTVVADALQPSLF